MRSIDTLIVHVGDIKSATTSVQVTLAAGMAPVGSKSLHYPATVLNHNYLSKVFANHRKGTHPKILNLREHMVMAGAVDYCVLSGELMSTLPPVKLKTAIEFSFDDLAKSYKIVHYIRPHLDRLISGYAERVKIGKEFRPLDVFLQDMLTAGKYSHFKRLSRWRKIFSENYCLKAMLPSQMVRGDAVIDFFSTILGSVPDDWKPPPSTNESMSAAGLAQVMRFQSKIKDAPDTLRHSMGYEFARLYSEATADKSQQKLGLSAADAAFARDAFLDDARSLDQGFFDGRALFEPALTASCEKVLAGESKPFDIPQDDEGQKISDHLLSLMDGKSDLELLGQRMRRARVAKYVETARSA